MERFLARVAEHVSARRAVPLYRELQLFTLDATSRCFLARRMPDEP